MGQVSALRTQIGRKETDIKGGEGRHVMGGWNPYHSRGTRKSSSDCAEDQPSLINSIHPCLTVINTILTVIHALRPSSSTHLLQIYCTRLTSPKSHISWVLIAKHDPTINIATYFENLTVGLYVLNTYITESAHSIYIYIYIYGKLCRFGESTKPINKDRLPRF